MSKPTLAACEGNAIRAPAAGVESKEPVESDRPSWPQNFEEQVTIGDEIGQVTAHFSHGFTYHVVMPEQQVQQEERLIHVFLDRLAIGCIPDFRAHLPSQELQFSKQGSSNTVRGKCRQALGNTEGRSRLFRRSLYSLKR
nr:hypothetical protein DWF04_16505 [Cereibacter sphaeroides f. sp. denitrificans]